MPAFKIITTPKCTGSMPNALTTGSSTGVLMMTSGAMSMKVPSNSRMMLISSSTMMGLSEIALIAATMPCWTCRNAISQPKDAAVPITSRTIAVVRTACSTASTKPRQSSSR
ncbi:hypothetical protein D9M72_570560 [compost metagenome]